MIRIRSRIYILITDKEQVGRGSNIWMKFDCNCDCVLIYNEKMLIYSDYFDDIKQHLDFGFNFETGRILLIKLDDKIT